MGRRIGGAGGGSERGSRPAARVMAAATAAVVVAAGGGAIGGVGGGAIGSTATGGAQSTIMRNLGAKKVDARNAARRGDSRQAWRRLGLRQGREHLERYASCVGNSVGEVRAFLVRNPCRRLDRLLVIVADADGNTAVVAVSWVELRSRGAARSFRSTSDTYGTGYVKPLAAAVLGQADVRLTGQHYGSRVSGRIVVSAEAEPLTGQFTEEVLDTVAEVAVWAPRR
jgi:hypothetical protein